MQRLRGSVCASVLAAAARATSSPAPAVDDDGLSSWHWIVIGTVGGVVVLCAAVFCVCWLCCKGKSGDVPAERGEREALSEASSPRGGQFTVDEGVDPIATHMEHPPRGGPEGTSPGPRGALPGPPPPCPSLPTKTSVCLQNYDHPIGPQSNARLFCISRTGVASLLWQKSPSRRLLPHLPSVKPRHTRHPTAVPPPLDAPGTAAWETREFAEPAAAPPSYPYYAAPQGQPAYPPGWNGHGSAADSQPRVAMQQQPAHPPRLNVVQEGVPVVPSRADSSERVAQRCGACWGRVAPGEEYVLLNPAMEQICERGFVFHEHCIQEAMVVENLACPCGCGGGPHAFVSRLEDWASARPSIHSVMPPPDALASPQVPQERDSPWGQDPTALHRRPRYSAVGRPLLFPGACGGALPPPSRTSAARGFSSQGPRHGGGGDSFDPLPPPPLLPPLAGSSEYSGI
eukprot:TRINITY_DN6143_c0_g1_i1.p1 TRINITY_DN6143_c0_g1~~TRINITY_DN6143_c0_g1_i1.p1  ORF type:complete len:457 (+),score=28.08 TRINITY_DN6143_c0_g1_i1:127-1497(+)